MGTIYFNGKSSQDYGIIVETPPGYRYPERDVEAVHVPGRNGDLVLDHDSYKNVEREYNVAISSDVYNYPDAANKLVAWLSSARTYKRLEDTYEPDFYRMAYYMDSGLISCLKRRAGRAMIKFICKPERFFKTGDIVDSRSVIVSHTDSGGNIHYRTLLHINNPSNKNAQPKIKVRIDNASTFSDSYIEMRFYPGYFEFDDASNEGIPVTYAPVATLRFKHATNLFRNPSSSDSSPVYDLNDIIIDSIHQDVYYYDSNNKTHSYLPMTSIPASEDFGTNDVLPYLVPGMNTIWIKGDVNQGVTPPDPRYPYRLTFEITPNWWTI